MDGRTSPGLLAQAWSRPLHQELLGTAIGLVQLWILSLFIGYSGVMVAVALAFQAAILMGRYVYNKRQRHDGSVFGR